jgi:hypothetical protein
LLRLLLLNPLLIVGAAIAGAGACRIARVPVRAVDLAAAAAVSLIAAEAAVIVAGRRRGGEIGPRATTALIALVLQMLLSIVLAASVAFSHQVGPTFVWWMLVMFWVTLLGVSAVLVRLVRAPAAVPATPAGTGRFDKF